MVLYLQSAWSSQTPHAAPERRGEQTVRS